MNRPFLKCGIIGIGVILTGILVMSLLPLRAVSLMDGFVTPIVAFEFARTERDVYGIFGEWESPDRAKLVDSMTIGNQADFVFMAFYSLFLITFFSICVKIARSRVYLIGIFISILALTGDILENVCLLNILSNLESGEFGMFLSVLPWVTWLKWGGLILLALLMIPFLLEISNLSRLIALWALVTAGLGIAAFMNPGFITELFSWFVAGLFLWLTIFSFNYRRQRRILI